jgi:hypothetical protein
MFKPRSGSSPLVFQNLGSRISQEPFIGPDALAHSRRATVVSFSETTLDIRPYSSYTAILAPVKDVARRHIASWERGRCPRAALQPAPGRLGHHVSRHYDRGGRCFPGLGQAKAGNARSDHVPGSLA